jgi:diadenosine tetraphosphatase ApaH/serine/threonine PP2A family protein phosphatase
MMYSGCRERTLQYDIIGDIHGQADKLEALLSKLGYHNHTGAWRQSGRQAIFVGDLIDRGPAQERSVDAVRRMVEVGAAQAVMGNHELNAIAWHTPDPNHPGEYLREHFGEKYGENNRRQHAKFLAEVEHRPSLHAEIIEWFLTLPLRLNLQELLVVHACWHGSFIDWLSPQLDGGCRLTRGLMVPASQEPEDPTEKDDGTPSIFKAVEALTKGIEMVLPAGQSFLDKDFIARERVRVRWWDQSATTYRSAAMLSPTQSAELPDVTIPAYAGITIGSKPVFFGHYWLTGTPSLESDRCACVDYSAGKGGALVAYRFDGEPELSSENFVWVA